MRKLKIAIVPDPIRAGCGPAAILDQLASAGRLPLFMRQWGSNAGDCHEIADALTADLANAAGSAIWMAGRCPRIGAHSWVECDGWAIDASNGHARPIVIQRAADYRASIRATDIHAARPGEFLKMKERR